ncbi:MAG: DNA mismatch repair endonuclease MutL, partial [Deltaproteobacteria bacterium]|nr:DNA mismatch repair endonuclease MutL [Deltaproteobacteria bacterium]
LKACLLSFNLFKGFFMERGQVKKIQVLPKELVHKIAAGEVVERPVSVVKELVENSLDAGATKISVKLLRGGTEEILVEDNGVGIKASELSLALKRHATSKIVSLEDLETIHTLGFRGEALASIAHVSRFSLESATEESAPIAYGLKMQEGLLSQLYELPRERGTTVRVAELFCTTPARKKFLKRYETEWSHVFDLIQALALAYLDVSWELWHEGKLKFQCPATKDLKTRVIDVFGKDYGSQLYPFSEGLSELELEGFLGHPNFCKSNNRHFFVYINGRYLQDKLLNHAILQGYQSLLMQRQYPVVILKITLDPRQVDVNVHPAKREVRFANGQAIHSLISRAIQKRLKEAPWRQEVFNPISLEAEEALPLQMPRPSFQYSPSSTKQEGLAFKESRASYTQAAVQQELLPKPQVGTLSFLSLRVIGQLKQTYILAESEESLVLIDQHAAHERIGYEKLKAEFAMGRISSQRLLTPAAFHFSFSQAVRLKEASEALERLGIEIDEFGPSTFMLKAVPKLLAEANFEKLLEEVVEALEGYDRLDALEEHVDHLLATMACHRQIRAGQKLEQEEMQDLLRQLEGTPHGYHCPHGRPVMVDIPFRELEKSFKRVL